MASDLLAHIEIPVKDIDSASKFYSDLFGWEFRSFGRGYHLYNTHKGFTVGLRQSENISTGDCTIFHVRVNDVDNYIKKVTDLGGKVSRGKTIIPAMGSYALINDQDGNTIGLYQGS